MTYVPGHSAWVGYGLETVAINTSVTPNTLPSLPDFVGYLGYMDVPEATTSYGAKKGFSIGSPYAQYDAKGSQTHSLSFNLRVGASAFLANCVRDNLILPYGLQALCIYVGVSGQYTDCYRFAYVDSLALNINEGSAQEVTAAVTLQVIARHMAPTGSFIKSPSAGELAAAANGTPLLFHDVRTFAITPGAGTGITHTDYRDMLMTASLNLAHGLERKGIRPNWGDDNPLSNTSYQIMPHLVTATGEITLHDRLDERYFNGAVTARTWGDITFGISDAPGIEDDATPSILNLTVKNVVPNTRVNKSTEASGQLSHSVSILADDIQIALS